MRSLSHGDWRFASQGLNYSYPGSRCEVCLQTCQVPSVYNLGSPLNLLFTCGRRAMKAVIAFTDLVYETNSTQTDAAVLEQ
mgnify:CR=1 FL=1